MQIPCLRLLSGYHSKVIEKTKELDIIEKSFTIYYDSDYHITLTAKNDKEALIWSQGLRILSNVAKAKRHLKSLPGSEISIGLQTPIIEQLQI